MTPQYQTYGVEKYYVQFATSYSNPHLPQIKTLLDTNQCRIRTQRILDLAAGSGEVTQMFPEKNIIGCDPFMFEVYTKQTGKICLRYSFEDIIKGDLSDQQFSSIICSFAMHLCDPHKLSALVYMLSLSTKQIVIITPHKRPNLEGLHGFKLIFSDKALTKKGKGVFLKVYENMSKPPIMM